MFSLESNTIKVIKTSNRYKVDAATHLPTLITTSALLPRQHIRTSKIYVDARWRHHTFQQFPLISFTDLALLYSSKLLLLNSLRIHPDFFAILEFRVFQVIFAEIPAIFSRYLSFGFFEVICTEIYWFRSINCVVKCSILRVAG